MYNNEVRDGRQRGFWLIDNEGHKQPVYRTLQQYYRNARVWVADVLGQQQRLPTQLEFDGTAVAAIVTVPGRGAESPIRNHCLEPPGSSLFGSGTFCQFPRR
jgi:hypothetical protein